MVIQLLAVHYDINKNITGFRLIDSDSGQVMDQPYQSVLNVVKSKKANIVGIRYIAKTNSLKGSNGSFDRYSKIVNNQPVFSSVVILNTIDNVGYRIANFEGKTVEVLNKELLDMINREKATIANGKLITKDTKQYISVISGSYINVPIAKSEKLKFAQYTLNKEAQKAQADAIRKQDEQNKQKVNYVNYTPKVITGLPARESGLKKVDPVTGLTVEQKLSYSLVAVKVLKPFYYSILNLLKRNEANPEDGIETMGVTLDALYFSSDYVVEKTLAELIFIFLHEVCHIAMKHRAREGNRDHELWNIACDYYINAMLIKEFGLCEKNNFTYQHTIKTAENTEAPTQYRVVFPHDILYNPNVNIETDTPEKLYEELVKLNNQQQNSDSGSEDSNQGNGQGQGSDKSKDSSKNQNSKGNGSGNSENQEQDNGEQSNQDGQEQEEQKENGQGQGSKGDTQNKNGSKKKKGKLVGKEFRGQKIPDYEPDMVTTENERAASQEQIDQISNSFLRRAVTIHRQTQSFGGHNADFLERIVEDALAPKIEWRSILKQYLISASQKINTFAAPDRRFRSRGMIMPGPKALENDSLKNIKVCVDTSGSISPKDLGIVLNQIGQLLRIYKAEAELLYWDTNVRAIYQFKKIDDLLNKKPMGGGGTDANCVFEYFETERDYKIGRKPKPSLIIVFTDGYIPEVEKKYSKYKDVLWVVQGNKSFKAPFGKIVPFKNN